MIFANAIDCAVFSKYVTSVHSRHRFGLACSSFSGFNLPLFLNFVKFPWSIEGFRVDMGCCCHFLLVNNDNNNNNSNLYYVPVIYWIVLKVQRLYPNYVLCKETHVYDYTVISKL